MHGLRRQKTSAMYPLFVATAVVLAAGTHHPVVSAGGMQLKHRWSGPAVQVVVCSADVFARFASALSCGISQPFRGHFARFRGLRTIYFTPFRSVSQAFRSRFADFAYMILRQLLARGRGLCPRSEDLPRPSPFYGKFFANGSRHVRCFLICRDVY